MEKQANRLVKAAKSKYSKAKRTYTCRSLKDLIKAYRACTTSAEERALVKKESAHIRDLFKEGDTAFRRRNISKLLFFHMNGYPTNFGMTECIKLCASDSFADKRVAYLGLMILVDETEDILMLVTNSLKRDLSSTDQHIVGLALTVLGDLASADMARDLLPEIEMHVESKNAFIRKKAALAAVRAVRKLPSDETASLLSSAPGMFESHVSGAHVAGIALIVAIAHQSPSNMTALQKSTASILIDLLRDLLVPASRSTPAVMSISGVRNPFMQVKVLHALRSVGIGSSPDVKENLADLLARVASSTDSSKVVGSAVLYECVRTIVSLDMGESFHSLAVTILGKFLSHKDPNVRYVGLQELVKVVVLNRGDSDIEIHRKTITACLREADPTIKHRAVELLYAIANVNNSVEISDELIEFLKSTDDNGLRENACRKICSIADRFSPSPEWHCDTFIAALDVADLVMPETLMWSFLAFVSSRPVIHGFVANLVYQRIIQGFLNTGSQEDFSGTARYALSESSGFVREKIRFRTDSATHKGQQVSCCVKPRLVWLALYIFGEYGAELLGQNDDAGMINTNDAISAIANIIGESESANIFPATSLVINTREDLLAQEISLVHKTALTALVKMAIRVVHGTDVHDSGHSGVPELTDVNSPFQALLDVPSNQVQASNVRSSLALVPRSETDLSRDTSSLGSELLADLGVKDVSSNRIESSSAQEVPDVDLANTLQKVNATEKNEMTVLDAAGNVHPVIFRVVRVLSSLRSSCDVEVQQRSCEYSRILTGSASALGKLVMCRMPLMDIKGIRENMARASSVSMGHVDSNGTNSSQAPFSEDLLSLLDESESAERVRAPRIAIEGIGELLALPSTVPTDQGVPNKENKEITLDFKGHNNIVSGNIGNEASLTHNGNEPSLGADDIADMTKKSSDPSSSSRLVQPETRMPAHGEIACSAAVLNSETLDISVQFSKSDSNDLCKTFANFRFTSKTSDALSKFVFQLSVPKYMKNEMKPASSSTIPPRGTVTQDVILINTLHGTMPVQLRFRARYVLPNGAEKQEQGVVSGIPKDL